MQTKNTREYTEDEVREMFLKHVWHTIKYWDELPQKSTTEWLEGLAFSMLAAIDGCSAGIPAFILAPLPAKEDKEYHMKEGENYFADNDDENIKCDIAGGLHETFHHYKPKAKYEKQ